MKTPIPISAYGRLTIWQHRDGTAPKYFVTDHETARTVAWFARLILAQKWARTN